MGCAHARNGRGPGLEAQRGERFRFARPSACSSRSDPAEQRPEGESGNEVEEGEAADYCQLP